MLVFTAVVERAGIRAAAERLGVSSSSVSRSVAALEARLGVRLFERTTRALRITESGQLYYAHCRRVLDDLAHAEALLQNRREEHEGVLRVSAANVLGNPLLGAMVPAFLARYPKVRLLVELSDRLVDLVPEGYDIAIRLGQAGRSSSLVSRRLAMLSAGLYASPAYLAAQGTPATPQALAGHRALVLGPADRPARWTLQSAGHELSVDVNAALQCNDVALLTRSAIAGTGIAMLPHFICDEWLDAHLVRVLPAWECAPIELRALHASHKSVTPWMRAFLDMLAEGAPAALAR